MGEGGCRWQGVEQGGGCPRRPLGGRCRHAPGCRQLGRRAAAPAGIARTAVCCVAARPVAEAVGRETQAGLAWPRSREESNFRPSGKVPARAQGHASSAGTRVGWGGVASAAGLHTWPAAASGVRTWQSRCATVGRPMWSTLLLVLTGVVHSHLRSSRQRGEHQVQLADLPRFVLAML